MNLLCNPIRNVQIQIQNLYSPHLIKIEWGEMVILKTFQSISYSEICSIYNGYRTKFDQHRIRNNQIDVKFVLKYCSCNQIFRIYLGAPIIIIPFSSYIQNLIKIEREMVQVDQRFMNTASWLYLYSWTSVRILSWKISSLSIFKNFYKNCLCNPIRNVRTKFN